jgi:hypothetical protein
MEGVTKVFLDGTIETLESVCHQNGFAKDATFTAWGVNQDSDEEVFVDGMKQVTWIP